VVELGEGRVGALLQAGKFFRTSHYGYDQSTFIYHHPGFTSN